MDHEKRIADCRCNCCVGDIGGGYCRWQRRFVDRDHYLVVYRLDGLMLAHGANERMVGKVDRAQGCGRQGVCAGAHGTGQVNSYLLAGLQVHQPGKQEGRADVDVLRAA
jgi:hypothetical protein